MYRRRGTDGLSASIPYEICRLVVPRSTLNIVCCTNISAGTKYLHLKNSKNYLWILMKACKPNLPVYTITFIEFGVLVKKKKF
jgi:hypothetical protein